jgi:hypothetical protein
MAIKQLLVSSFPKPWQPWLDFLSVCKTLPKWAISEAVCHCFSGGFLKLLSFEKGKPFFSSPLIYRATSKGTKEKLSLRREEDTHALEHTINR